MSLPMKAVAATTWEEVTKVEKEAGGEEGQKKNN